MSEPKEPKKERWAFSRPELDDPAACKSYDELMAYVDYDDGYGRTDGQTIIVYRNGEVSNRYGDGTAGVLQELAKLADCEETLLHPDGEMTDVWRDCEVDDDGNFIRFLE